jgi:hypothetical protein
VGALEGWPGCCGLLQLLLLFMLLLLSLRLLCLLGYCWGGVREWAQHAALL